MNVTVMPLDLALTINRASVNLQCEDEYNVKRQIFWDNREKWNFSKTFFMLLKGTMNTKNRTQIFPIPGIPANKKIRRKSPEGETNNKNQ